MSDVPQNTTNPQLIAPGAANALSLTPSGVAWTNTGYSILIASTATAIVVTGLCVQADNGAVFHETAEIDVATGAPGSEVVVTTFRAHYGRTYYVSPGYLPCPLPLDNIAAGVAVSLRMRQSTTSVLPWQFALTYYAKPVTGLLQVTAQPQKTYPSAANNIALTINATPWTNSTWTQLVAATASAIVLVGCIVDTRVVGSEWEYDLGIGAPAAETVLTTVHFDNTSGPTGDTDGPSFIPFLTPLDAVPTASRLTARTRASIPTSRQALVSLVYVPKPL